MKKKNIINKKYARKKGNHTLAVLVMAGVIVMVLSSILRGNGNPDNGLINKTNETSELVTEIILSDETYPVD